jgi:uncharacterized protein (UPF0332 family)
MTDENRRANAAEELARAGQCLKEAEVLGKAGLPYGAASRAYYAIFHAARALLFSAGLEATTHRGVVSLLGEHFVKPGHLPAEMGRLVSRMQRDREDADYQLGAVFTDAEAVAAIASAERFIDKVQELLAAKRP